MLEKELETAIALARLAGLEILGFYQKGIPTEEKIGAGNFCEPVTIADRAASELIVAGLQKEFPDDGILSEELPDTDRRLSKRRVWIIDPLDGTRGFIQGNGDFAVQIGLAEDCISILGVVYLPTENLIYYASRENGSFLAEDGKAPDRLRVSEKTDLTQMDVAVSRSHRSPKMSRVIEDFGLRTEVRRGSVGLKVGLVARQICDLYIHFSPHTKHWDSCAPEIIIREAGGDLTDLFGGKIIYNTKDVRNHNGLLASCGAVAHEKTVTRLRPLLNEFGRLRVVPERV